LELVNPLMVGSRVIHFRDAPQRDELTIRARRPLGER
jgi:hypothetical protein